MMKLEAIDHRDAAHRTNVVLVTQAPCADCDRRSSVLCFACHPLPTQTPKAMSTLASLARRCSPLPRPR